MRASAAARRRARASPRGAGASLRKVGGASDLGGERLQRKSENTEKVWGKCSRKKFSCMGSERLQRALGQLWGDDPLEKRHRLARLRRVDTALPVDTALQVDTSRGRGDRIRPRRAIEEPRVQSGRDVRGQRMVGGGGGGALAAERGGSGESRVT